MSLKGIELPVNSVIIIALGIFVLLLLVVFFLKGSGDLDKTQVNSAFNQGCSILATTYTCDYTKMSEVETSLTINNQPQDLLQVCRLSFNNPAISPLKCKNACSTCQKIVFQGSPCEEDSDCWTPLTPSDSWGCLEEGSTEGSQVGNGVCRSKDLKISVSQK